MEQLHVGRGGTDTDPDFNLYIRISSIDALQEFDVVSGIYPAEFGREAAQINVSAKSATNRFRVPSQQRSRREAVSTSLQPVLQKLPCTQSLASYADDTHKITPQPAPTVASRCELTQLSLDTMQSMTKFRVPLQNGAQARPSRYPVFRSRRHRRL